MILRRKLYYCNVHLYDLLDYQIESRICIREPKLEIEATLSYDEFYDALLTLRVKYMENVNYCDAHVVKFHTNCAVGAFVHYQL